MMTRRYIYLLAGVMNEIRSDHTQSRWCWQTNGRAGVCQWALCKHAVTH